MKADRLLGRELTKVPVFTPARVKSNKEVHHCVTSLNYIQRGKLIIQYFQSESNLSSGDAIGHGVNAGLDPSISKVHLAKTSILLVWSVWWR